VTYRFHAQARIEFDVAVEWYENQQSGLGDDFIGEVVTTIHGILASPSGFAPVPRAPRGREVGVH